MSIYTSVLKNEMPATILEAGAQDCILLYAGGVRGEERITHELQKLFRKFLSKKPNAKREIVAFIKRCRAVHIVHSPIDAKVDHEPLYQFARELVYKSSCLESVKVGIFLFGLTGCTGEDVEAVKLLGRFEEFTMYTITALELLFHFPEQQIWELAQSTFGWGRIFAVNHLARTSDMEVKRWLLRDGHKNTVMGEYLAHICAKAGDLAGALRADIIDDALLEGAREILRAMLEAHPPNGLVGYKDAKKAVERYIYHAGRRAHGIRHFALLIDLQKKFGGESLRKILLQSRWREEFYADRALLEMEQEEVDEDLRITANFLGEDMWEANCRKLSKNPLNPQYWHEIFTNLTLPREAYVEDFINSHLTELTDLYRAPVYVRFTMEAVAEELIKHKRMGRRFVKCLLKSKDSGQRKLGKRIIQEREANPSRSSTTGYPL